MRRQLTLGYGAAREPGDKFTALRQTFAVERVKRRGNGDPDDWRWISLEGRNRYRSLIERAVDAALEARRVTAQIPNKELTEMNPPPIPQAKGIRTRDAIGAAAIVIVLFAIFGGKHEPTANSSSHVVDAPPTRAADSPKTETEKPEPVRPTAGQEVSEEYFDWINRKMGFKCQHQIKGLVRNDMRSPGVFSGTNSMDSVFFLLRFDRWSKRVANDGTIRMRGDQAEAQNGLGNWMRVTYSCTVNIDTKTVTDVSLDNGRLN